jgi:putative ABC transport system ATP-binding protein
MVAERAAECKAIVSLVRLINVSKLYQLGEEPVYALKNISLTIEDGVFLAIAGPSGSGKSTLLNLIGCIDTPSTGEVYIGEQLVSTQTPDQLADLRARSISFVFQTFNLLPVLTAEENVEYPLLQFPELSAQRRRRRVQALIEMVGLARYAKHRPNQLSGGQRQRVAIARALATKPRIVLADEPTANLDHKTGTDILNLMKALNRRLRTTFIFSTHDRRVMAMADRLIRIEDGELTMLGVRRQQKWTVIGKERLQQDPKVDSDGPNTGAPTADLDDPRTDNHA